MDKTIQESIESINEEINMLQQQKTLLEKFEIKPVTSKEWHDLCETPLRGTDILVKIAEKTFPMGTNFKQGPNYVYFDWKAFTIACPTSRCVTFEVSRIDGMYKPYFDETDIAYTSLGYSEKEKYLNAVKNHEPLSVKAKLRYPNYKTWVACIKYSANILPYENKIIETLTNSLNKFRLNREKEKEKYIENTKKFDAAYQDFLLEMLPFLKEWTGEDDECFVCECKNIYSGYGWHDKQRNYFAKLRTEHNL